MSAVILWIDSKHAKAFKISADGVLHSEIKHHSHSHSNGHEQGHKNSDETHFFKEVSASLGQPEELLVFGPGVAKNHFKNFLETHSAHTLYKHLIAVEPLDKVSDNQILEAGRKFFKKWNTYNVSL